MNTPPTDPGETKPPSPSLPPKWQQPPEPWPEQPEPREPESTGRTLLKALGYFLIALVVLPIIGLLLLFGVCLLEAR